MTYKTLSFEDGVSVLRDMTPEEEAAFDALQAEASKPVIPQKVTRRQARQALLLRGRLDQIQPAIDALVDPTQRALAQIEWDDSQDFERDRPLLIQIGTAIGLDAAGLDDLFVYASTL
jgi:DnaJ-domain-containing protein 1